jgi:hypothetical protein
VAGAVCWIEESFLRRRDRGQFRINPMFDRDYSVGRDAK